MPVIIEIKNLQTKIPIQPAALKTAIRKVLKKLKLEDGHLSIVFVDDRKIRKLNCQFLNHDYATDVLTFDLRDQAQKTAVDGEIVISAQTAKRHATTYATNVKNEILLYMVHGLLHLLGYDDHSPSGIKKMRARERDLLSIGK